MQDFCVWNICNSNCVMCTNPLGFRDPKKSEEYSKKEVLGRMEKHGEKLREENLDITLTGGEPTLHPSFLELLEEIRKRFPENTIAISTNGRRFVYEDFTRRVLSVDNLRFHLPIHADKEEIHDRITRTPGSFKETLEGIKNIYKSRRNDHRMEIRVVLLEQNYERLGEIFEFLFERFPDLERMVTIFPEYEGRADKNFNELAISYPEVAPIVEKETKKWRSKFNSFSLYHFPLCVLSKEVWPQVVRSLPADHPETCFLDKCKGCAYKKACLGIYKDYLEKFSRDHFEPVKEEFPGVDLDLDNYHRPVKSVDNC